MSSATEQQALVVTLAEERESTVVSATDDVIGLVDLAKSTPIISEVKATDDAQPLAPTAQALTEVPSSKELVVEVPEAETDPINAQDEQLADIGKKRNAQETNNEAAASTAPETAKEEEKATEEPVNSKKARFADEDAVNAIEA